MNDFLRNQFVNLTTADLTQIDQYYPKAQQFSGRGAFWRAAANAYGEMRYTCPGIYVSSVISTHGEAASYNYQYVLFLSLLAFIEHATDFSLAGTSCPLPTPKTASVLHTQLKLPPSGAPPAHQTTLLFQRSKHTGHPSSGRRIQILISWRLHLSGRHLMKQRRAEYISRIARRM